MSEHPNPAIEAMRVAGQQPVACDVCGKVVTRNGMGNHKAMHDRALARAATPVRKPKPPTKPRPELSADDLAYALIAKASGGSIPATMLPEVVAWWSTTTALLNRLRVGG